MDIPPEWRFSWASVQELVRRQAPNALAAAIPRVYADPPAGYLTAQQLGLRLAVAVSSAAASKEYGADDPVTMVHGAIAENIIQLQVPVWWIGKDLVEALQATDLPPGLRFADVPYPLPSFALILPRGLIKDGEGGDVEYIQCNVTPVEEDLKYHRGLFTVSTMVSFNPAGAPSKPGPAYHNTEFLDDAIVQAFQGINERPILSYGYAEHVDGDTDMVKRIARVAISASFLLASRPDLVEAQENPIRRVRSSLHGGGKVPLQSLRWLGRTYRTIRPSPVPGQGTHASPRLHWRRGHWRDQRIGEGRKQRKIVWIQPVLVGSPDPGAQAAPATSGMG